MSFFGALFFPGVYDELLSLGAGIRTVLRRLETIMATQQEILDKLAASEARAAVMEAALAGIQGDITALKDAAQSGNLDAINAAVDSLSARWDAATATAQGIDQQT